MKVLITGATGLIGKELVSLLLDNNIDVHYLTTSKSKIKNQENYKGFYWNPSTGEIDPRCFAEVDAIIHLAGASVAKRWTNDYKLEIIDSRLHSAELLYISLKGIRHRVKQIIISSGIAIYPNGGNETLTEECKEIDSGFLSDVMQKNESYVGIFEKLNINVCKLRQGIILSAKGGMLNEVLRPIQMGIGAAIGTGEQLISWIHINDVCNMYLFALQNNLKGAYNAVAPDKVTNKGFTKLVATKLNRRIILPNIPVFIIRLLFGEKSELLLENKDISSQKIIDRGFTFEYKTIDSALNQLLNGSDGNFVK